MFSYFYPTMFHKKLLDAEQEIFLIFYDFFIFPCKQKRRCDIMRLEMKGKVAHAVMTMPVRWQMKQAVCDAYEAKNSPSSVLHGHHHFLLTLITRGHGIQILNGREIPFGPNDLFLLSPADFHQNTLPIGESFDHFGVRFPYELLDA